MDDKLAESAVSAEGSGLPIEVEDNDESLRQSTTPSQHSQHAVGTTLQALTDKALHFLSHASNETLGACLVGFGAATYVVLGRVGLLIIGVAGGVVLHATWDGSRGDIRDEASRKAEVERRRETGLDIVKRLLDLRSLKLVEEQDQDVRLLPNPNLDFSRFEPETTKALNVFTDAVIKDYVHYWYTPQIPDDLTFPAACRRTLVAFILSLSSHLERKRPADAFLDFTTNASSIIIVFLTELAAALNASPSSTADDAVSTYLRLKPESNLASVLDEEHQEYKFGLVSEDILQAYLNHKAYNDEPVHIFLKEVLAKLVLGYTLQLCSKPEWINDWIVYLLEESETTKEVMDIVDAGVEGRPMETPSTVVDRDSGIKSKKEGSGGDRPNVTAHQRKMSKAEEAMDEAMKEAKRLTQLMIEEDERRAREEREKLAAVSSSEDVSDATASTQGAPTPTSSQSDKDRQSQENLPWTDTASPVIQEQSSLPKEPATPTTASKQFTSFDQLVPSTQPTALTDSPRQSKPPPPTLTLLNANISIFDDSVPGDRTTIKNKPSGDYLIQIEPASSAFPGWMIARKYADFETLHEVLRRISVVTGARFGDAHADVPRWRTNTKAGLRQELERYISDALRYPTLAESEGMKRFLDKEQGNLGGRSSGEKKGFGWPTPDAFGKLGGDMMNVLTKAPQDIGKGVAGGGKAIFGGVAGLVGGVKKPGQANSGLVRTNTGSVSTLDGDPSKTASAPRASVSSLGISETYHGSPTAARASQESLRALPNQALERRGSTRSNATSSSAGLNARQSTALDRPSNDFSEAEQDHTSLSRDRSPYELQNQDATERNLPKELPPPPSHMPDDYGNSSDQMKQSVESLRSSAAQPEARASSIADDDSIPPTPPPRSIKQQRPEAKVKPPLTDQETSVAIELMFAVITEVYNLSSAWQIRRTLLTAAKTYLLRPGNPQLSTIRDLLQTSTLDANLSDSGMAGHVYKLRENALPTEEEMEIWRRDYPEKTAEQKEQLRRKARDLLVRKGMPQALTSVMGAAASGEALGKVFDCLQIERVSRGLVFGLMLQALKVVTH